MGTGTEYEQMRVGYAVGFSDTALHVFFFLKKESFSISFSLEEK